MNYDRKEIVDLKFELLTFDGLRSNEDSIWTNDAHFAEARQGIFFTTVTNFDDRFRKVSRSLALGFFPVWNFNSNLKNILTSARLASLENNEWHSIMGYLFYRRSHFRQKKSRPWQLVFLKWFLEVWLRFKITDRKTNWLLLAAQLFLQVAWFVRTAFAEKVQKSTFRLKFYLFRLLFSFSSFFVSFQSKLLLLPNSFFFLFDQRLK